MDQDWSKRLVEKYLVLAERFHILSIERLKNVLFRDISKHYSSDFVYVPIKPPEEMGLSGDALPTEPHLALCTIVSERREAKKLREKSEKILAVICELIHHPLNGRFHVSMQGDCATSVTVRNGTWAQLKFRDVYAPFLLDLSFRDQTIDFDLDHNSILRLTDISRDHPMALERGLEVVTDGDEVVIEYAVLSDHSTWRSALLEISDGFYVIDFPTKQKKVLYGSFGRGAIVDYASIGVIDLPNTPPRISSTKELRLL